MPAFVRVILKAVLLPLIAIWSLSKFNLFSYITLVPKEYQFEVGLTVYMATLEAISELLRNYINHSLTRVTCIFYSRKEDKALNNNPSILCSHATKDVAYVWVEIELRGNVRNLSECIIYLSLPDWLSSQVASDDSVMSYFDGNICWNLGKMLSSGSSKRQPAHYSVRIPFIRNSISSTFSIYLEPHIRRPKFLPMIFEKNCVKIRSEER